MATTLIYRRASAWWPWLYLAAVTAIVYTLFRDWAYDDPFITYRYADNLRRGIGFVYNPGERVLSTTTPLFALILATMGLVVEDLPRTANFLGALSLAGAGLALFDLGCTWRAPWAGLMALAVYPTFSLLVSTLGSETPLALALSLWGLAMYARQRNVWAAGLLALAVLARPDAALVPAVVGAHFLLRRRGPIPWEAVGLFIALLAPWVLFAWAYFGSPLPATLAAKQAQGTLAVSQGFAPGLLTVAGWYAGSPWFRIEAFLAVAGLFVLVAYRREWLLVLVWPLAYFAAYSLLGVTRYFWYYAPLVPGFVALAGLGVQGTVEWAGSARGAKGGHDGSRPGWLRRAIPLVALSLILVPAAIQARNLWILRANPDPRYMVYRQAGEWLRENTDRDATVGALEVGIIGFYAGNPMVDFAGLLQPEVAARFEGATSYEEATVWAVERYRPDYLILNSAIIHQLEKWIIEFDCMLLQGIVKELAPNTPELVGYACSIP